MDGITDEGLDWRPRKGLAHREIGRSGDDDSAMMLWSDLPPASLRFDLALASPSLSLRAGQFLFFIPINRKRCFEGVVAASSKVLRKAY